ncbi:MAG: hypothetical protein EXR29_15950 [Betaproteobacteria bacterium]|nr:hypothetical protein [Betaproteobacteria bacterium]
MSIFVKDPVSEDWRVQSRHRTQGAFLKEVLKRDDGLVGGFELTVIRNDPKDFYAARHSHGFDQIRIGLQGTIKYEPQMALGPRMIGFFPAGTSYGPHTTDETSIYGLLQWDGNGKGMFCSIGSLDAATARLQGEGTFSGGFFQRKSGTKVEAWQASFEEATGRKPSLPPAKYPDPVFMYIDAFPWKVTEGGAKEKTLGVFGDPETRIEMRLIPKDGTLRLGGNGRPVIAFVVEGDVRCNENALGRWSGALAEENDVLVLRGMSAQTELIVVTLPCFKS